MVKEVKSKGQSKSEKADLSLVGLDAIDLSKPDARRSDVQPSKSRVVLVPSAKTNVTPVAQKRDARPRGIQVSMRKIAFAEKVKAKPLDDQLGLPRSNAGRSGSRLPNVRDSSQLLRRHEPPKFESRDYRAPLMTYREAARELSVSLNHLRNQIKDGRLKSVSVGPRAKRVARKDIEEIIRSGVRM